MTCATIGCPESATRRIRWADGTAFRISRTENVCTECADSYLARPALPVTEVPFTTEETTR